MLETDFIHSLGTPLLAHRLKRASDLLVGEIAELMKAEGMRIPLRGGSALLLLAQEQALSVTEVADRLRLSHPLIVRVAAALEEVGYVKLATDPTDRRRRVLSLTSRGKLQAQKLTELNEVISKVYRELFAEIGVDLISALDRLEAAALAQPLRERFLDECNRQTRGEGGRRGARESEANDRLPRRREKTE